MSAGTIALTNNSATAVGTGTAFTTDLKTGDFIAVIVGGVTYTLGVKSIESATSLTLIQNYGGPSASGLAWTAVPNATLVGITAQVAADVAKAIRGLNLDKANWQAVYSSSGNITVILPDGSSFTGPSWNSIVDQIAANTTAIGNKAGSGVNADITSLTGLLTPLSLGQGGTGGNDKPTARTSLDVYSKAETLSNTYNDATVANTPWINITGSNGWVNHSGQGSRSVYRKLMGRVYVTMNLTNGTNSTPFFTLPAGYRPPANVFITGSSAQNVVVPFYINPAGVCQMVTGATISNVTGTFSFDIA